MTEAADPSRHPAPRLAHVLQAARMGSIEAMEQVLANAQAITSGATSADDDPQLAGAPYLLFRCEDVVCAAPLESFSEVLPGLPTTIPLPGSPTWMLGIFLLRTELLALVDPAPLLLGRNASAWLMPDGGSNIVSLPSAPVMMPGAPCALVIGAGERALALAVREVGSIVHVRETELRAQPSEGSPAASRYLRGIYQPEGTTARYLVPNIDALMDDLLEHLAKGEESCHA